MCARNAYCSFQVAVTAAGEDLAGIDVSLTDLTGPHGARIASSQATLYREDFLNVFYRSSAQGDIGEWPDPLVPQVDPEYGEKRNAFPCELRRISRAFKRYRVEKARTQPEGRSRGEAVSGGNYSGEIERRYVIEIVKAGPVGEATFRWWSDPGDANPSMERPTAAAPLPLDSGVTVEFHGEGRPEDFLAGDEFWIFAGPARHQPVWVDVLVPAGAGAGEYTGEVQVTAKGKPRVALPIELTVLNFALPATTMLLNSFQMYWPGVALGHFPEAHLDEKKDEARKIELGQVYARAALRDGVTLTPSDDLAPTYTFNADGSLASADYARYDHAVGGFLDGSATPTGAQWTSLPLPRLKRLTPSQRALALRDFVRHAREKNWYDRLFDYTYDEPRTPEDFAALRARARMTMEIDAHIPRLVTTNLNPDLVGLVTRWCPVVNALAPKYDSPREKWNNRGRPGREAYDARLQAGDSLWWYQSCMSFGCGDGGRSPQYDNWPSYMVDTSAVANRVFGLLTAVTYRISGILYWDVAYAHLQSGAPGRAGIDPWESQYFFGGNGDGSLFYPGRPERVGGKHHIAIESLRLKMIRESLYDAEYALLLRQFGEQEFLEKEVGAVVEKAWRWNADPHDWLALRQSLGKKIETRTSTPTR